jgi:hypothetical protein
VLDRFCRCAHKWPHLDKGFQVVLVDAAELVLERGAAVP